MPLLAYTGDTSPAGLDAYPPVFEAKILITEMSFIRAKPPPREDPQVRPHAPGRLPGARRPLRNELIVAATSARATTPMRCEKCSNPSCPRV